MNSEYIYLDDQRVTLKSTRSGRVFSLDGKITHPDYPFPHTIFDNGFHIEPRMNTVHASPKSFNLNEGDFAKIVVEDVPLLGIVLELADHHYDIDLFVNGVDIYGNFSCISSYLPSSDGFGKVDWIMLNRGRHEVEVKVANKYNRMLDSANIKPSHACLSGFILMNDVIFPPPLFHSWVFSQDDFPADIRGRRSSLKRDIIPAGGYLYLMDLYGHGSLDNLGFDVDYPVVLEMLDGGAAQAEFKMDFPSWIRRVDLANSRSGALSSVVNMTKSDDGSGIKVIMTKPAKFGSRLIIRLFNQDSIDHRIEHLYMEGTVSSL
jgi:hypothetical protein